MRKHVFRPVEFYNTFGGHEPVLAVESGDTIETQTVDAHGFDEQEREIAGRPNPLTGPFALRGAVPGDCVAVEIEELSPSRLSCWTRRYIAPELLVPELFTRLPELVPDSVHENRYVAWRIDPGSRTVQPVDLTPGSPPFPPLALAPMLGCIGTAPAGGQAISTATSGPYGGNMDYVGVRAGTTLYLPVNVEGAMLSVGDGHATQGHGEIGGTGTEVSMHVRFTLRLIKGSKTDWPRGENSDSIFTMGNARPLDEALKHATTEMLEWLIDEYHMDAPRASLLMSQAVEYEVGNVFDPAFTMVCKMQKRYLSFA